MNQMELDFSNNDITGPDVARDLCRETLGIDIFNSHKKYTNEVEDSTVNRRGPFFAETIRGDDNDINRWIGLRRPNYYATTPGAHARVVPSEDPHQMSDHKDERPNNLTSVFPASDNNPWVGIRRPITDVNMDENKFELSKRDISYSNDDDTKKNQ